MNAIAKIVEEFEKPIIFDEETTAGEMMEELRQRAEHNRTSDDVFKENETAYDALFDRRGVEKKAEEVVNRLGVSVPIVVKSKYELKGAARKAKGYYNLKSGKEILWPLIA